jgi:hypothetical protein
MDSVKTKVEKGNKGVASLCLRNDMPTKLLIIVLLVSTCTLTSFAQISFGVKAGTNVTSLKGSTDKLIRSGFHTGLHARIHLYKTLYFVPEVLYVQKGSFNFPLAPVENLRYFEVPLLLTYMPVQFLEINVGVSISSKLDSTSGYGTGTTALSSGLLFNLTERLFLSSRFNYDLTAFAKNEVVNQRNQKISENITGYSIMLSAGYRINNKSKTQNTK